MNNINNTKNEELISNNNNNDMAMPFWDNNASSEAQERRRNSSSSTTNSNSPPMSISHDEQVVYESNVLYSERTSNTTVLLNFPQTLSSNSTSPPVAAVASSISSTVSNRSATTAGSLHQKVIRENLLKSALPSMMANGFSTPETPMSSGAHNRVASPYSSHNTQRNNTLQQQTLLNTLPLLESDIEDHLLDNLHIVSEEDEEESTSEFSDEELSSSYASTSQSSSSEEEEHPLKNGSSNGHSSSNMSSASSVGSNHSSSSPRSSPRPIATTPRGSLTPLTTQFDHNDSAVGSDSLARNHPPRTPPSANSMSYHGSSPIASYDPNNNTHSRNSVGGGIVMRVARSTHLPSWIECSRQRSVSSPSLLTTHFPVSPPRFHLASSASAAAVHSGGSQSLNSSPRFTRTTDVEAATIEADLLVQKSNEEMQRKMSIITALKTELSSPPRGANGRLSLPASNGAERTGTRLSRSPKFSRPRFDISSVTL